MKRIRVILLGSFFIFLMGLTATLTVFAEEGSDFTVVPNYGAGQTNQDAGYFSIKAENEKTYPIKVTIFNLSKKEDNTFSIQLVQASTTNNGRIDYTPSKENKINSGDISIIDLAEKNKRKQQVTIKANESREVEINLKVPKEGFKGTLLGSIYVKKMPKEQKEVEGIGVINAFAMTIPIIMSQDFDKKIAPQLELTDAKLVSDTGVPKVVGEVSNFAPTMFGQIFVKAWVTEGKKSDKLFESEADSYEMAPNSSFQFTLDTKNHLLKPGTYTYHMVMKSGEKTFNLKRDFTVNQKIREEVNKKLLQSEPKLYNIWLIVSVILGVLLFISLLLYFLNRKKGAKNK